MSIVCIDIADNIYKEVEKEIKILKNKGIIPTLAILKNNLNQASSKYVDIKIKKANELGVRTKLIENFNNENELIQIINNLNEDKSIHGYIVQLPLPIDFNQYNIFEKINIKKDVDGLSMKSIFYNYNDSKDFYPFPCTPNGIMEVFKSINYDLEGKNVVIINKSIIVGKPLSLMLLESGATVTICNSKTNNISFFTKNADVVIVAVGIPNFLSESMIGEKSIIIDVGISVKDGKIVGDVSKEACEKSMYYTPVPNGIGKLTVAMIFKNLINLITKG